MKKRHRLRTPYHEELLVGFGDYLVTLGYRPVTVRMLVGCTQEFLWRLEQSGLGVVQSSPREVVAHHAYLQARPNYRRSGGLSVRMIHHHLYSLRVFFDWLQQTGQLCHHPMSNLTFPRSGFPPREVLTRGAIEALYAACQTFKERAVLSIFYGCGLRRSEGVELRVSDVGFREGVLYVRSGKGGRSRSVPMSPGVQLELRRYLEGERFALPGITHYLTNSQGLPLSGNRVNHCLKVLLARAGLSPTLSLHNLRHSIATHLLEGGLSVDDVRDFLGHQHLESTQVYTRVNPDQFRQWS